MLSPTGNHYPIVHRAELLPHWQSAVRLPCNFTQRKMKYWQSSRKGVERLPMTLQMLNVLATILKQSVVIESQQALHELQVSSCEDPSRLAVLCKPRCYAFLMTVIC